MESPERVLFCTRQNAGFLFIFFVGFGFFLQGSSSSSVEARCESNSSSDNSNHSFRKYIMKSYFGKYDSLLESNFQNFVVDEVFSSSCKLLPDNFNHLLRVSVSGRNLSGEGSHRHILSTIRFHMQPDFMPQLLNHFCKVIIIERLPSGVFADPFELQHLLERGVFTDVAVFGDTNLELPSVHSNQSVVEIHMNVCPTSLLGNKLEISVDLPLHARYPSLDDSGYSKVKFGEPDLFLSCSTEGESDNESCLLMPTNDRAESITGDVVWRIPSGIRAHSGIVSAVTFLAASISTLLIVLTSIFSSDSKFCNNLKES